MTIKENPRRAGRGRTKIVDGIVQSNSTPIYAGSKVVGYVIEGTLYKTIHGSKHLLRRPPALGFDVDSLNQAELAGATRIEVTDAENGTIYRSAISHVRNQGFPLNRGFGEQIALHINDWTRHCPDEPQQLVLFS